jgi:hypothetical protein
VNDSAIATALVVLRSKSKNRSQFYNWYCPKQACNALPELAALRARAVLDWAEDMKMGDDRWILLESPTTFLLVSQAASVEAVSLG